MKWRVAVLPALIAIALGGTPAEAGSISIAMTPTAQLTGVGLTVYLKVSNTGNEAAQSVAPALYFRGQEMRGEGKAVLDANECYEWGSAGRAW